MHWLESLKAFGAYQLLASVPLIFFGAVWLIWTFAGPQLHTSTTAWKHLATVQIALLVLIAALYVPLPVLTADLETNIVSVAFLASRGAPLYPPLHSVSRYIELYGPATYLPGALMYRLFGPHLYAAKVPGFLSVVATLWATYGICRHYAPRRDSQLATACVALAMFRWGAVAFYAKSDPLLLAGAALTTLSILRAPPALAVVVSGLYFGLAPNMKVSAFTYLAPLFALMWARRGWMCAAFSAALGAVLLPVPFLLPAVSFSNWLQMMGLASVGGMSFDLFSRLVQYSILYLLPVLMLISAERRLIPRLPASTLIYFGSIVFSMAATCLLTCRPGAAAYHLLPFLPSIANLYFLLKSQLPRERGYASMARVAAPLVFTLLFYSASSWAVVLQAFAFVPKGFQALAEIHRAERSNGNSRVEVGYGDDFFDQSTWYRYQTALDGQPYTIDGAAIRDHQIGGVEIPESTLNYLRSCGTGVWLIPKGKEPFVTVNSNFTREYHLAFNSKFRTAFLDRYRKTASGNVYDVWSRIESRCRAPRRN